jgi:hypothetical protein
MARSLLVDGHVHIHPEFRIMDFLAFAERNFARAAQNAEVHDWMGILLLSECAGIERFGELRGEVTGRGTSGTWTIESTGEEGSLSARSPSGRALLLVAGRQIRVEGGLEVLALCTTKRFPDGGHLKEVVDQVREAGAVPVIPWGFGKWWAGRGRIVASALRFAKSGDLILGDSAQRPHHAPDPRHFQIARDRGIPILNGTDPLRFPAQVQRAGS